MPLNPITLSILLAVAILFFFIGKFQEIVCSKHFKYRLSLEEMLSKVAFFQTTFKQPVNEKPTLIPMNEAMLRYELMKEENEEYLQAVKDKNLVEIADALGDQAYILLGTINHHGMQHIISDVFNEIQASNMSKLGYDGQPIFRADGKVMKGPDFFQPNLKQFL